MKPLLASLVLPAFAALLSSTSQAQTVDFNSAGDLSSNFSETGQSNKYTRVDAIGLTGLAGDGGVQVSTASVGGSRIFQTPIASGFSSVTSSIDYQYITPTDAGTGAGIYFGFATSTSYSVGLGNSSPTDDNHILAAIRGDSQAFINNKVVGVPGYTNFSGTQSYVNGRWYNLEVTLTPTGGNDFDFSYGITDLTTDLPVVATTTGSFTNAGLMGASNLYAFFGGQGNSESRGVDTLDNFSLNVVPEPSAYSAIAGLVALGMIALRRR